MHPSVGEFDLSPIADCILTRSARRRRPILVGLAGAQGSGKTTVARRLSAKLAASGKAIVALSLDDFYLSHRRRAALASTVHPLLATRGPPGTHDLALIKEVTGALLASRPTRLPRFSKASDDVDPAETWPSYIGPADIVLLEGWCVGATPQADGALATPVNLLEEQEDANAIWRRYVNAHLSAYQSLFSLIDIRLFLKAPDFSIVSDWRLQQERELSAQDSVNTLPLLQAHAMQRFVQHYERLTRHMLTSSPVQADIVVTLGPTREVLSTLYRAEV